MILSHTFGLKTAFNLTISMKINSRNTYIYIHTTKLPKCNSNKQIFAHSITIGVEKAERVKTASSYKYLTFLLNKKFAIKQKK